jgi:protein-disulfide isomerase
MGNLFQLKIVQYIGLGLALLASVGLGLYLGNFASLPALGQQIKVVQVEVTATPAVKVDLTAVRPNRNAVESQVAPAAAKASGQVDVLALVLADARHIAGSAEAPITIVEFSDFK